MIGFRLSELARELPGVLHGEDAEVTAVSTDTRTLAPGELFVALRGPRHDGHDHIGAAAERGAAAALVERPRPLDLPQLAVADTRRALGRLGALWRQRWGGPLVAVTGSNGKTTVKEMIAAILARRGPVLATRGNLNNDIGLPLTLCRLQDQARAVVELGANHPGEIEYLATLARPQVAVLNNAARAHLEGFGSVAGVARAKAEILAGLDPQGTFVFNADDPHAGLWRELAAGRALIDFGVDHPAAVHSPADSYRLSWTETGFEARFQVNAPWGGFEVRLALAGAHNRMNALAAIAAAGALGYEPQEMQAGLATLQPVPGRLQPRRAACGARLLDDSYNANPDSVGRALEVLVAAPGRRLMALGDLGELGHEAPRLHAGLGEAARRAGVARLYTCGPLGRHAAEAFGPGARHCADRAALIEALQADLGADDVLLVKGSRAARMDEVVDALCGEVVSC